MTNWKTIVIVGAQWGDEGKGKVTDWYAHGVDYVVRFQGGNNAGHTIVYKGKVYKLHLLPSGVLYPRLRVVIGNGTVIDPRVLFSEINKVSKLGFRPKLYVADRAHIIFPFQVLMDSAGEEYLPGRKLSALSTRRGIWPTYADKAARVGIRVVDLVNPKVFKLKYDLLFDIQCKKLELIYGYKKRIDKQYIYREYLQFGRKLKPYVVDASLIINQALDKGERVLFEGAQGTCLDVDHGIYPYTTSSNTTVGAVCTGVGINPKKIDKIIGVVKAYVSRVGGGHLPTELVGPLGDVIRERGAEYGTTTGRPRRIGWLDLVQVRLAQRINGFDCLAITKIDVLGGLEEIRVCLAYKVGRRVIQEMPADLSVYEKCQPIYRSFPGWPEIGSAKLRQLVAKGFSALPLTMQNYIKFIERKLKTPVELISLGAEREATIIR